MENLTLIIPAKYESESLPNVLEELKKFKYNISTIDEFKSIINHRDNKIDEFKQALSFCGNYFTEQDTQKTQSIFKKLIK